MRHRVLIIDDSRLVRFAVSEILSRSKRVELCGEAADGVKGLEMIRTLKPDLVILDVEMPALDGLTLLKELRRQQIRVPVLMLSHLTQAGARTTLHALELGAIDFIPKPSAVSGLHIRDLADVLLGKVHEILSEVEEGSISEVAAPAPRPTQSAPAAKLIGTPIDALRQAGHYEIIAVGSSTGGPQALHRLLRDIPAPLPAPMLIVQHMPPVFTAAFSERLNSESPHSVHEAATGMVLEKGEIYIAPGNFHMRVSGRREHAIIDLDQSATRHAHRPSIDVLFESVLAVFGQKSLSVIMTGMGWDGAKAMRQLFDSGAGTIAQDESSSVVFGMNRRAIELGGVEQVVSLYDLGATIQKRLLSGPIRR